MNTKQHTKTPWKLASRALITAKTAWQMPIAICYDAQSHVQGPDAKEADANAAFIVRACNAHDDLVAVVQERIRCIELEAHNSGDDPTAIDSQYDDLRAALAKAKAGA